MTSPTFPISTLTTEVRNKAAEQFQADGFLLTPPVIPLELIERVSARMDAIVAGDYETGIPPAGRSSVPGSPTTKLHKIDNAHLSDHTVHELVSHPALGQWAAAVTGASMVQVFATQLLVKPRTDQETANVGWHQDLQYWQAVLRGELLTAWVAISDVTADSGPMRFVRGSHHWGLLGAGDFFSGKLDELRERIQEQQGGTWEEVAAVLAPGGMSLHHNLTMHGSGANHAPCSRKSFAIHLRTNNSSLVEGAAQEGWLNDFDDEAACPVVFSSRS